MKNIITICFLALLLTSCQTESLQSFMVDHKSDENFISVDFSLRTFVDNFDELDPEQKEIFEDVNKVNFIAFKKNESNDAQFNTKREQLLKILSTEFEEGQLMSLNVDGNQMQMFADNVDKTVEEIVVFASNNEKGFLVARLLGDDLNPENFMKLAKMSGEMDFESLSGMIDGL
jgi:hypothetical protein